MKRRKFMQAIALGGVGIGAAMAAEQKETSQDEVIPKNQQHTYVREATGDEVTIEVGANQAKIVFRRKNRKGEYTTINATPNNNKPLWVKSQTYNLPE